jgi:hypothetical protein
MQSLPMIHGSHQSLKETHWFEAIFKLFGSAVFEVIEVKGGRMAKEWDFEAKKNQNRCKTIKYSTLILCLMAIFCQSKPTITSQKSEQVNKVLLSFSSHFRDLVFGCFWQRSYQNIK